MQKEHCDQDMPQVAMYKVLNEGTCIDIAARIYGISRDRDVGSI